jgi:hypothetical protein
MSLDRNLAHAVLSSAALVSTAELERTAHEIVDRLWGIIDAVAAQAAAQEMQRHRRPSTSPPPSRETEAELLQARRVKALEAIAIALTTIAKKESP